MTDSTRPCIQCGQTVTGGPAAVCGACGHHQNWRLPKDKPPAAQPARGESLSAEELAHTRARARAEAAVVIAEAAHRWLEESLPGPGEIADEMLAVLRGLARADGLPIEAKDRISAAKAAADLAIKRLDPVAEFERLFGSPEDAIRRIEDDVLPALRRKVGGKALKGGGQ